MLAALLLIITNVYIFMNTKSPTVSKIGTKAKAQVVPDKESGKWIVYGTTWCGWTKKQLAYLDKKGVSYDFIDCEKGDCNGIDAFPVLESPQGERFTGYKEI